MNIEGRKSALEHKHTVLEDTLDKMSHQPSVDDLELTEIKKQKLAIKDEIARMAREDA